MLSVGLRASALDLHIISTIARSSYSFHCRSSWLSISAWLFEPPVLRSEVQQETNTVNPTTSVQKMNLFAWLEW